MSFPYLKIDKPEEGREAHFDITYTIWTNYSLNR